MTAPKPIRSVKEPPPTRLVVGDSEISDLLRAVGLNQWRSLAVEFAGRLDDVRQAVATWRANQSRFDGPGAIAPFLRSGVWPVDGVVDPAVAAAAATALADKRKRQAVERAEFLAYREAREIGRVSSWTAEQVDSHAKGLLEGSG